MVLDEELLVGVALFQSRTDGLLLLTVFKNDGVFQELALVVSDLFGLAAFLTVLVVGVLFGSSQLLQILDLGFELGELRLDQLHFLRVVAHLGIV